MLCGHYTQYTDSL